MKADKYFEILLNAQSKNDIYKSCFDYCKTILKTDRCRVYFFDDSRDFLICRYRFGQMVYSASDDKISANQSRSIVVRTALENAPQIIEDIYQDSRADTKVIENLGVSSIISYPLQFSGIVQGVISFDFTEKTPFSRQKLESLTTVIRLAAVLHENWILKEKVSEQDSEYKKELEKKSIELDRMNEQLLLRGRLSALGQLASGVAHEIKNPLAVIKMLINTIDSEIEATSKFKNDFTVMKTEIERLEEIVNHFLNFARPRKVEKLPVNINDLILDVCDFLKIKFNDMNIFVNMDLYVPAKNIMLDANQIKQVFINIFLNAIEACKTCPSALIHVKTLLVSKKSGTVMKVEISDNGPGIKEEIISQIFDPFTTGRTDGLGLGLSICYRIITDHGGKITAKNRLSGGAKFEILLPVDE